MKEKLIELMERTLSAYSIAHIERYFNDVKRDGLKEHGFPRLASNIGILIAHGRRRDLMPIFLEMMEFCCKSIPKVKAANDFSVREVISCLREVEAASAVDAEDLARWKGYLATVDPYTCYDVIARKPTDKVKNWALFSCVSEFFRQREGLCHSEEFIDIQVASQLQWLDENGMYMDALGDIHHHVNYDMVPRGLFVMLLDAGYCGKYRQQIDAHLRKAALLTLKMQSPNGEMAFGGRSNQFLYNEEWMIVIYEYEARRYVKEGNLALANKFLAAAKRAIAVTDHWLSLDPIRHIKNRFPTETKFGCEDYAYFDKYMITVASKLHAAYLTCDDSLPEVDEVDHAPTVFETTYHFHKFFMKAEGYGIEFDLNADQHYDCSGLGRIQREGAPSAICLSVPCPGDPIYTVDIEPVAMSFCPAVKTAEGWKFATHPDTVYEVVTARECANTAEATLSCRFADGREISTDHTVGAEGVEITVRGEGEIAYMLPAFFFDGEEYTDIRLDGTVLSVGYKGWICRYTSDAPITYGGKLGATRNGHVKQYLTSANDRIKVKIEILKA